MSRAATMVLLAVIGAAPAAAQPAQDISHNQSIGAGAQWALPYSGHGEPPGIEGSWRRWSSPRLGIGVELRLGGRSTTSELNTPTESAERLAGQSVRGRDDRRISSYGLAVGVLGRGTLGRLSLIAGAGPALSTDRTTYARRINDVPEAGSSTLNSIGVHALTEIDVRATSRLSVFAGLRIDLRDLRYPESSFGYPAVGVRFAF